jgi:hypothetical protein
MCDTHADTWAFPENLSLERFFSVLVDQKTLFPENLSLERLFSVLVDQKTLFL